MDVLLGILGLIVGLTVCFGGLGLFFILLPVWGFVTGFLVGAAGVTAIFGDGFLSSLLGLIIGLVVAVVFAALSYLYWYIGAVLAAGSAGGILGAAIFASLGVDSSWLLFFIGLGFAAVFVLIALVVNLPVYIVVINTALAGSAIALGGLLLVLNRFDREEIGAGTLWRQINDNLFLWLIWLVVAVIGMAAQLRQAEEDALQIERWARAQPGQAA